MPFPFTSKYFLKMLDRECYWYKQVLPHSIWTLAMEGKKIKHTYIMYLLIIIITIIQ